MPTSAPDPRSESLSGSVSCSSGHHSTSCQRIGNFRRMEIAMTFADANDVIATQVAGGTLPGAVTLVAHGDDVNVGVHGTTTFGGTEPMRRVSVFRLASLTKPVVAAAAMMLVDDGVLALDQPVDEFLPELAAPRVLRTIDGPLDDTVPADGRSPSRTCSAYRIGSRHPGGAHLQPAVPDHQRGQGPGPGDGRAGSAYATRTGRMDQAVRCAAVDVPARRALAIQHQWLGARCPGGASRRRAAAGSPGRARVHPARHDRHRVLAARERLDRTCRSST